MRIPTGNFGNVVAAPEQQVQYSGRDPVGAAVGGLGQALGQAANVMQQVEAEKQRSQSAVTLATLSNDLHDVHDQIGRDVTEGKMPAGQAIPEFQKRMGELTGERTKDLSADQRAVISEHLIKPSGALQRNLSGIAIARTQNETGANLLSMGEQFQRAAMRDLPGAIDQYGKAVDTMGPAAGWSPEKIAQQKQVFKEGATFNFANATLEGAANKGDIELIRAARAKIESDEGEVIDPARRTALITKSYGYENGIIAAGIRDQEKQQREQEAKENKAFDAYKEASNTAMEGRYLSTEAISNLAMVTAGTKMAPAVQELVKSQAKFAGFASYPLAQQSAEIERLRAAGSTRGVGTSPDEEKFVDQLERIRDAGQKDYAENPWNAAQTRGVIKRAPEISINDLPTATAVLGQRMAEIGTVEAAAGRKISPLQPLEAEGIGRMVRSLPPDQQSSALAGFSKIIGDGDRLIELARQFDAKDKVLGTAMMVGDLQTSKGRYVSELVIKGARAIKDKSIIMDEAKETGVRAALAQEVGDAYPNEEVRSRIIDAAYFAQAGLTAEGNGDVSNALRLVAGEIVVRDDGKHLPLPRAMDEGEFDKRLANVTPAKLLPQTLNGMVYVGKTSVPIEEFVRTLPSASLVHAGAGRYNVRAGMGLVTNERGQRITIEVGNAN